MADSLRPEALDALVARIWRFFETARSEDQAIADGAPMRRMYFSNGRGLRLSANSEAEFEKLIDALRKHELIRDHVPRETLSQRLMTVLLSSQRNDDIGSLITKLVAELASDIKMRHVYIPIAGIDFASEMVFQFGDMTMRKFDHAAAFDAAFHEPLLANLSADLSEAERAKAESRYLDHLRSFRWRPTLVIDVETSPSNVRALAFDRAQPICDFWQFCVGTIMTDEWVPLVDFRVGSLLRGIEPIVVVAEDRSSVDLPVLPGGAPPVLFTKERLAWLDELGLLKIKDIFAIPDGDEGANFDALLRRAIQSFADAERSSSRRQKLLSYAAAAEVFFASPNDTTNVVTHGIAKILAAHQNKPHDAMLRAAASMYEVRSRAIHDAATPTEKDLRNGADVAHSVILAMTKRRGEFADRAAIFRWSDPPPPFER